MAARAARRRPHGSNPALWIVSNPGTSPGAPTSERYAWNVVQQYAEGLRAFPHNVDMVTQLADAITQLATDMKRQLARGVHANPGRRVTKLSDDVQAIVYEHVTKGPRCHGYGNADIDLKTRGDALTIVGLHERTGVEMLGMPDGSVVIKHRRGLPVWGNIEE